MSESKAKPSSGQALSDALAKLKVYDHGSPRAPLLPIDRAASSLPSGSSGGKQLEQELLAILRAGCSVVAQDYVCSRFVLVGSEAAVPALEALLGSRELTTSARTALEHIPHAARDTCPAGFLTQAHRRAPGRGIELTGSTTRSCCRRNSRCLLKVFRSSCFWRCPLPRSPKSAPLKPQKLS
jgi:hypothetical protein